MKKYIIWTLIILFLIIWIYITIDKEKVNEVKNPFLNKWYDSQHNIKEDVSNNAKIDNSILISKINKQIKNEESIDIWDLVALSISDDFETINKVIDSQEMIIINSDLSQVQTRKWRTWEEIHSFTLTLLIKNWYIDYITKQKNLITYNNKQVDIDKIENVLTWFKMRQLDNMWNIQLIYTLTASNKDLLYDIKKNYEWSYINLEYLFIWNFYEKTLYKN